MLVYCGLIAATRNRVLVFYKDVAGLLGIRPFGNYMQRQVGQVLVEISEDEHGAGRPVLSAVAVNQAGFPSDGFFTFARTLGLLQEEGYEAERAFWEADRDRVHEAWR